MIISGVSRKVFETYNYKLHDVFSLIFTTKVLMYN